MLMVFVVAIVVVLFVATYSMVHDKRLVVGENERWMTLSLWWWKTM
jgi:hypothetical protein